MQSDARKRPSRALTRLRAAHGMDWPPRNGTLRIHVTTKIVEPDVPVEAAQRAPARPRSCRGSSGDGPRSKRHSWPVRCSCFPTPAGLPRPPNDRVRRVPRHAGLRGHGIRHGGAARHAAAAAQHGRLGDAGGWPGPGRRVRRLRVGVAILETDPVIGSWFVLLGVVLFGPALFLLGPDPRIGLSRWPAAAGLVDDRGVGSRVGASCWLGPGGRRAGAARGRASPSRTRSGSPLLPTGLRDVANAVMALALVGGGIVAVASLVVRYRRSRHR